MNLVVLPSIFCACSSFFDWLTTLILGALFSISHQVWIFSAIFKSSVKAKWPIVCHFAFKPSCVYWLPILVRLDWQTVHFVLLTCISMGVVAPRHLDQGWCQLPLRWSFCRIKHSSDWSFASACCSYSLCFPKSLTGVQTLLLIAPLNLWM